MELDPIIDVPVVREMPEIRGRWPDPVQTVDFLLTMLFQHEAGTLYADFNADGGRWHVRGWTRESSGPDEVIATIEPLGGFRMLLARIGGHYMSEQVYGGYSHGMLTQNGRTYGFAIYMANDQWRGYWVRAYSRYNPNPVKDGDANAV